VSPRACLDVMEMRRISCIAGKHNLILRSSDSLVTIPTELTGVFTVVAITISFRTLRIVCNNIKQKMVSEPMRKSYAKFHGTHVTSVVSVEQQLRGPLARGADYLHSGATHM
jgi:hypothetical protein